MIRFILLLSAFIGAAALGFLADDFLEGPRGSDRQITSVRQDAQGNITHICNLRSNWNNRSIEDAIDDIDEARYAYYVIANVNVVVRAREGRPYLITELNQIEVDNLDELPPC